MGDLHPSTNVSKEVEAKFASKVDDFDPQHFEPQKGGIGFAGAVVHIITFTVSTGVLALPLVHKKLGYAVAILETLFVGFLYYHIVHILANVEYKLCKLTKTSKLTLMDTVEATFKTVDTKARYFEPVVKMAIHFYFAIPSANSLNLIMIANNMQQVGSYYGYSIGMITAINWIMLPVMLICCVKKLKKMVPFSALANFFTLIIIFIILGYSLATGKPKAHSSPVAVNNLMLAPQCFAVLLGAFRATGIYLPLKNEMKYPNTFASPTGVVNVTGVIITLLNVMFGAVIYCSYGSNVRDNVIKNFPQDDGWVLVVRVLYIPAVLMSYYMQFYVRFDMYWTTYVQPATANTKYQEAAEYGTRFAINLLAYLIAVSIPKFGLFAAISGTLGLLADIAVAPFLDLLLLWYQREGDTVWWVVRITKNCSIIVLALSVFLSSLISCVNEVILLYQ